MENNINTFKIGGDPEFAVVDGGNHRIVRYTQNSSDRQIGFDHGGSLVELRPHPSYSVQGFLDNIKNLLDRSELDSHRGYIWRAGAYYAGEAMGGHVHFELPARVGSIVTNEIFNARVTAFDRINEIFELLKFFPHAECTQRRDNSPYGRKGSTEIKSDYRFEYRMAPSWMFSPQIAFAFLTMMKLAAVNPTGAMKLMESNNPEKAYKGLVKMFCNFQHIDNDAFIAAKKVCRSANPDNIERLHVDVTQDFKPHWKSRGTKAIGVNGSATTTAANSF
jgi:hypothetical protein